MGLEDQSHCIDKVESGIQNVFMHGSTPLSLSAHVTVHSENLHELTAILMFAVKQGIRKISYQYVSRTDSIDNENMMKVFPYHFDMKLSHWDLPNNILLKRCQIKKLQKEIVSLEAIAAQEEVDLFIDPIFKEEFNIDVLLSGRFILRTKCTLDDIVVTPNGDFALCPMLQHVALANINDTRLDAYIRLTNSYRQRLLEGFFFPVCHGCCKHTMFYNS